MSKMSDMAMTIEELRNAAAAINDAANWLAQQFSSDDKQQIETIAAKPEKKIKPALTLEEVRAVLADKSRAGHTTEIRELLKKYGASKLSKLLVLILTKRSFLVSQPCKSCLVSLISKSSLQPISKSHKANLLSYRKAISVWL